MKCERIAFIIIYCVLSSLCPADSWAKKPSWRTIKSVEIRPNLTLGKYNSSSSNAISKNKNKSTILVPAMLTSGYGTWRNKLAIDPRSSALAQIDIEPQGSKTEISQGWYWVAIAITSGISLFLLWSLFRKPQHLIDSQTEPSTQKIESDKIKAESVNFESGDRFNSIENIDLTAKNNIAQVATVATPRGNIDRVRESVQDLPQLSQVEPRRKAIWELAKVGDYRSIEPLLKIMPNVEAVDRNLIFEVVNQIINRSFESANRELFANLQHEDPQVRLNGIRDLKQLYQFASPAISKLAAMQSDPDYEVRQTATQTLQQLNVNPTPPLNDYSNPEIDRLVSGEDSKANLHLVAYLLEELDVEE